MNWRFRRVRLAVALGFPVMGSLVATAAASATQVNWGPFDCPANTTCTLHESHPWYEMNVISPNGTFPISVLLNIGNWLTYGNTDETLGGFGSNGEVGFNNSPATMSGFPMVINPDPSHDRTFQVHLDY